MVLAVSSEDVSIRILTCVPWKSSCSDFCVLTSYVHFEWHLMGIEVVEVRLMIVTEKDLSSTVLYSIQFIFVQADPQGG